MAIYLKKFENHTQYDNYINGSGAILPNVSICTTEGDVHYNPSTPPTPAVVTAIFNIISTSEPTKIAGDSSGIINGISAIEIDGILQPTVESEYTFNTLGEHTIRYTLTDPTTIGEEGFYGCSTAYSYGGSLISVSIPNTVTTISRGAFGHNDFTSIVIPDSVTTIDYEAFTNCYSLTSVTLGSGVTYIENGAFCACDNSLDNESKNAILAFNNEAFCCE